MLPRTMHQLAHGLRLIVTEQPYLHGACVTLAVRCGSRDDMPHKAGLTHFLEHMLFRGSANYPDAQALIAPFEQAGGTLTAETWRDHTLFSALVHPDHIDQVIGALGDMITHPAFTQMAAERHLVEAELAAELDEEGNDVDICNLSRAQIWGDHPMGRRIVGSPETLARLTKRDVRHHHARHYVGPNMVLSVAGRVTSAAILAATELAFAGLSSLAAPAERVPPTFLAGPLVVHHQPGSQTTLQLTFAALPDGHPDFSALTLLVSLLDDGMGTRLHRALSERTGLVYAFTTGLDCYADGGLYDIEMQVSPDRVEKAMAAACLVLEAVMTGDVDEAELAYAQRRALMAMEIGQDDAQDVAQEAAVDVLFDRPGPAAHRAALKQVTLADISRVAQALFLTGPCQMTLMGPTTGIQTRRLEETIMMMRKRAQRTLRKGPQAETLPALVARPLRSPYSRKAM